MKIKDIKEKIFNLKDLSLEETIFIFDLIMSGSISEVDITSILIGLKLKTESPNEILGAVKIMRSKAITIESDGQTIDTCGTGGDMIGTLNISTSAAIVAASAGAKVAKHGNRSISSKSGSADMLEKLGYKISDNLKDLRFNLEQNKFCFLFAQYHHNAMKHVIKVRKELGTRTIFNLLGPLTNPANTKRHLLGVYDKKWVNIHCKVLKELGSKRAMVVHGQDGLDEISLSAPTFVSELKENKIKEYILNPKDYGYEYIDHFDILGGDPEYNSIKFLEMIDGHNKKFQQIIELNAGAAIYLTDITSNLNDGFKLARHVIDSKVSRDYFKKIIS